jgi:RHS repeat-associated protein
MATETYNAQNHLSSGLVGYDAAGDIISDVSNQYVYDAEGRLCAVQNRLFGGWTGYLYDAAGNRVAKGTLSYSVTASNACNMSSNGFTQTAGYVVGPSGEQLTEVNAGNNWVHTNAYAGGKLIGTYDAKGLHLYVDDPLGTRRVQVNDATGAVEATYQSLPFGDGYTPNFATGTDDPTENHFTNKERDTESGNDFFNARYYNSNTARFLSPDPLPWIGWQGGSKDSQEKFDMWIANPQNLNEYAYVNNNPMNHTDPTGMNACGTNDDKTCKVTITITARSKGADGKYNDGFSDSKKYKNEENYNATATVTINGKAAGTFLAKSTPDSSRAGAPAADGTYASIDWTHHSSVPGVAPSQVISINSGNAIPTTGPNPNQGGDWFATDVEIHKAGKNDGTMGSPSHPVSSGCQTIQSDQWSDFQRTTGLVPTAGNPQHQFTVNLGANGSGK